MSNFNPRTHVECDCKGMQEVCKKCPISIHALTQSATARGCRRFVKNVQFQSTHSRRVRLGRLFSITPIVNYFNPRTHVECDAEGQFNQTGGRHFNPRTHVECDEYWHKQNLNQPLFQSTHSRRVRPLWDALMLTWMIFQSTHSRRVRLEVPIGKPIRIRISIHALTQSATLKKWVY